METRSENWKGSIPLSIRLSSHDMASVTEPHAFYILIPRISYLNLHIDKFIKHFENYVAAGFNPEEIWFSSENEPLRWDSPIGVLFDKIQGSAPRLPWILHMHFGRYPDKFPQYRGISTLRSHYLNSLKESTALLSGSANPILKISADNEGRLWNAVSSANLYEFWEVLGPIIDNTAPRSIPIRVAIGQETIQQRVPAAKGTGEPFTVYDLMKGFFNKEVEPVVQGVKIPLDTPLLWLWQYLLHADNFLYVIILDDLP